MDDYNEIREMGRDIVILEDAYYCRDLGLS